MIVAWIENEVQASNIEIDPYFIDSLQHVSFKFDFLQFWTVKSIHIVVAMYIVKASFIDHWKCLATIVVEHSVTNLSSIKCYIKIQSILTANFYETFQKEYFSRNLPKHSPWWERLVEWNEEETHALLIKCNLSSSKLDQLSFSCRNEVEKIE